MQKKTIFLDWYNTLSKSLFWEQFSDPSNKYHEFGKESEMVDIFENFINK
jgi:hypothetical protein